MRFQRIRPSLLAVAVLALPGMPVSAEMCFPDPVPAATLLVPYFEVDLDASPSAGINTVFTIHNALPEPTVAHVSFWTDWSQPTLDFDIFLTGYDVQTVNLYDVLALGIIPVTADEQSDQGQDGGRVADPTSSCDGTVDSCSPHGSHPEWDGSFSDNGALGAVNCIDIFPFFVNPLIPAQFRARLQAKHTGQPIEGACFGADHGDRIARGYITIDNANTCSLAFPSDTQADYFSDGVEPSIASNVNQLWGDWLMIDPRNEATLSADPMVHIEADDDFNSESTPTGETFYGRYTRDRGGIDNREPLVSAWSFSYVSADPWVTDLVVWRDSKADDQDSQGYACGKGEGSGPDWHPLGQTELVCFNQTEGATELCSDADCLPLETQRVELGDLDLEYDAGWCQLNLNIPRDPISRAPSRPPEPPAIAQSWVGATVRGASAVAGGLNAVAMSLACEDQSPTLPVSLFLDGFETGDTSAWTVTMP